jgi:hypothetical protein
MLSACTIFKELFIDLNPENYRKAVSFIKDFIWSCAQKIPSDLLQRTKPDGTTNVDSTKAQFQIKSR